MWKLECHRSLKVLKASHQPLERTTAPDSAKVESGRPALHPRRIRNQDRRSGSFILSPYNLAIDQLARWKKAGPTSNRGRGVVIAMNVGFDCIDAETSKPRNE